MVQGRSLRHDGRSDPAELAARARRSRRRSAALQAGDIGRRLPADTDAGDLARYVSTVMYGMAVRHGRREPKELSGSRTWLCEPGRLACLTNA